MPSVFVEKIFYVNQSISQKELRMKHFTRLVLGFVIVIISLPAVAQDRSMLSLERLFNSSDFRGERFGPARWLADGSGYTTLEGSETAGGRDIVKYESQSGKRQVLVSADLLIPKSKNEPLRIEDYSWSPDGLQLLIFTNSQRVWRQNTRGDFWVLNLKSRVLRQLGGDAKPSTLMFTKFSPDSRKVCYVAENNVYVEDVGSGDRKQLTADGSVTIINGTFDWVYEEELSLRDGMRWSPDSKRIAYWQLDAAGVRDFLMINNTDSLYSFVIPVQYPKTGTTNSACRVGVVGIEGGATVWMDVPGDSRNNYIARMDFAATPEEIVLQHLNRKQNTLQIMLGDVKTGKVRTILTERDDTWIDIGDDLNWMESGKQFTWVSERDGWRHAYLASRSGGGLSLVTPGEYDVIDIQHIDEKGGWLYFIASPENPSQRYLYRARMNGKGKPERLTPSNQPGSHSYTIAPNGKWAFHTFSSFGEPSITDLVDLPSHKLVRSLSANNQLRETIHALKRLPTEFFRVDIGEGVKLDGWVIKPPDFDPSKRYPVLFHVYGEPAGQTVLDRWGGTGYLWHLMLAQKGYVVVSVDNRGTPAPRGRAWRKSIYKQIGILASLDQAAAAKVITTWPYIDATRVGIWGWSGGGSMTLNMMFRNPDLYHTGMSVAPVANQKYYDTIYQERYMGTPEENPEGYKNGSPMTHAEGLKGNLLLVHGTGDDNVHFQNSEALINRMIELNKNFTMMAYPNRSHGIYEGRGTTRHLYELLTGYLMEHLPPGPR